MANDSTVKINSLAEFFLKDSTAKEMYRSTNPASRNIDNYIFAAELLQSNVQCALNNNCEWFQASGEERQLEELLKLILCICCDRIFHLRCTGEDVIAFTEQQLPWICSQCKANPLNPEAQALVVTGKHLWKFNKRIEALVKADNVISKKHAEQADEHESDSDNETVNRTVNVTNKGSVVPDKYIALLADMKAKLDSALAQNERLKKQIDIKMSKDRPLKEELSSQMTNMTEDSSMPQNYAAAVLKANSSATNQIVPDLKIPLGYRSGNHAVPQTQNTTANNPFQHQTPVSSGNLYRSPLHSTPHAPNDAAADVTIQHINLLTLNEIRRSLPKIETFDGRPEKWLTFQRAVERNQKEGKYPDALMKNQIRQALSGPALARVDSLIDFLSAAEIMQFLKESFGNTNVIVESARQRLMNVKLAKPLTHASCVEATTLIASFMSACTYAGLQVADSSLSSKLHNQLESYHQQAYYEFFYRKFPNATTRLEQLDVQFEFLIQLSRTLPLGNFSKPVKTEEGRNNNPRPHIPGKSYQLHSSSINQSSTKNDSYKFELRDKETAFYIGYDLNKVKALVKQCEFCGKSNHFSVECDQYKDMRMDERHNIVRSKNLCLNCLLTTTHSSKDCNIKLGCGFRIDKNARCTAKHHITLHRGNGTTPVNSNHNSSNNNAYKKQQRRARSNRNAANANNRLQGHANNQNSVPFGSTPNINSSSSAQANATSQNSLIAAQFSGTSQPNTSNKAYQMCTVASQVFTVHQSSPRTVKLFKTFFYGNTKKAIGYSVGDSAAEVTLVKRDLIEDLEIKGESVIIDLQWTDSVIKKTEALKVSLRISGVLPNNKMLTLDECYAVDDLHLPPRTLNVEQMKSQFMHLRGVPFDSYKNAIPSLLIGSRHAYMIEAVEPVIHDGSNKPIAIRTLLGYSIYGGAPECVAESSFAISTLQIDDDNVEMHISNEKLEQLYIYACSIDSLGIKHVESRATRDEQEAINIVNEEMRILPNGSVELPLIWKRENGQIPRLPNNYPMVLKRQPAQRFSPLVPRKSRFTTALLFHYHYKYKHVGLETQMSDFRSKYWMPRLRSALRKINSLCNYCGYICAHPIEYKMAPLPNVRIDVKQRPFQVVGLDCAGPYIVYANNGHSKKVWILIFTCTYTRFISLHLLDTMTADAVLEQIVTFWTPYGPVDQFISDNGTNFVGAANTLMADKKIIADFLKQTSRKLESRLAEKEFCTWKFIPVQSPWFGAFYERLIQTVKRSIATSVEGRRMSRTEFNIALQEAAHRINCRPLTDEPLSQESEPVLTPHHLVKYRSGFPLLPSTQGIEEPPKKLCARSHYKHGRILAEEIARKFISYYLPELTKRTKWFKEHEPIKPGDLVLVIDPMYTRDNWRRARIQNVYYGKDSNVRVVDLLFPDGSVHKNRSVKRLAKLDIKSI